MATYSFTVRSVDEGQIWTDLGNSTLNIPAPDSIDHEILVYQEQEIYNYNKLIFTYSTPLSGGDEAILDTYMSTFDGVNTDSLKGDLANNYVMNGLSIIAGLNAKALIDGKTDFETLQWFTQLETVINALNAGFLSVALDRLTSLTSTLINFLTGTMTSGEVTELRQLLQKLLGKTVT